MVALMRTLAGPACLLLAAVAGCAIAPGSRAPGEGCNADVDCSSGVCGGGTCAPNFSRPIGQTCLSAIECSGQLCLNTAPPAMPLPALKCTRTCTSQSDCPVGWACGLAHPEDAAIYGATCYPATWATVAGGFGTDCSLVSEDPKSPGKMCVAGAMNPCAMGFVCHATARCDVAAYCTKGCATDLDCPPTMFCGALSAKVCVTDNDCSGSSKCMPVPNGTAKVCTGDTMCLKREFCSPCAVDDQCPPSHLCATDTGGNRFCGKLCDPRKDPTNPDIECPQPANIQDSTGNTVPAGDVFEKCVPSAVGSKKSVCRPRVGQCHGPSSIAGIPAGGVCAWCRTGEPGDCPNGECFVDAFTTEHFCTQGCTATVAVRNGNIMVTNDDCPKPGAACLFFSLPPNCTNGCAVQGLCAPAMSQYLTCFLPPM
jgi:hypothetical protein